MGNGRLDVQALVVQSFQLFVVLLCGVHLKQGSKVAQQCTDSVGARDQQELKLTLDMAIDVMVGTDMVGARGMLRLTSNHTTDSYSLISTIFDRLT